MTKQDFFLKATAMFAQAFSHNAFEMANVAAKAAANLITAAETEWANIDAEAPLFDVPETDPAEGDDTPNDGEGGTTNDGEGGTTDGEGGTTNDGEGGSNEGSDSPSEGDTTPEGT